MNLLCRALYERRVVVSSNMNVYTISLGARGSVVDWGIVPQAGRLWVRVSRWISFFNLPNPSSRTMGRGPTQHVTEMSTRNLPGGKGRPARKADSLTAIYEPIV
jgi:hypothetical protein